MIIACPQCDTRFVVPSTVFRNGPRKVRCASCKHVWEHDEAFEQEEDEVFERDEANDFADHLARVEATPPETSVADDDKTSFLSKVKNDFKTGFKVIIATCATILFLFFIYQFLTPPVVYGEGLAFNKMTVTREEGGVRLTGEVVNSFNEKRGVPIIEITAILAEGIEGDSVLVTPDKTVLDGGETLPMSAMLENIGPEVRSLTITFQGGQEETGAEIIKPSSETDQLHNEGH